MVLGPNRRFWLVEQDSPIASSPLTLRILMNSLSLQALSPNAFLVRTSFEEPRRISTKGAGHRRSALCLFLLCNLRRQVDF